MCQNITMRAYGARTKRYCVLCSKHIAVRVFFVITFRDKPPGGARICETGLLHLAIHSQELLLVSNIEGKGLQLNMGKTKVLILVFKLVKLVNLISFGNIS